MSSNTRGGKSKARPSSVRSLSGWVPLLMSGTATCLLATYLATGPHEPHMVIDNGVARPDESPTARLWQLLILLQLPVIGWFGIRWFQRDPKGTVAMLAAQALAIVVAAMPVFLLEP